MQIIKLFPTGFCFGVKRSYDEIKKVINSNNTNSKIYLLGWLVHNKNVINELSQYQLILLDDKQTSRYELIQNLDECTNHKDIIILSAHGTDQKAIDLAKAKGYQIVDLTCPYVYKTHLLIKKKLAQGYEIYFIGKQNHPETKAILKIDSRINLITSIKDVDKYNINQKSFCTNQTTLSILEIQDIISHLKQKQPTIEFVNDICDATTNRQKALMDIDKDVDIILILGDLKSSNSNELYKIANTKAQSYLISNVNDIDLMWFNNKKKCVVACAASCPESIVDEVITYLDKEINCGH